jgi:hypothetical protein
MTFSKKTETFGGKTSKKDSGGGGDKSKKADKVKKSDIVERYKEINDQMEKLSDTASDNAKVMDRLYGASRLKYMEKQNSIIKDEIKLLEKRKE